MSHSKSNVFFASLRGRDLSWHSAAYRGPGHRHGGIEGFTTLQHLPENCLPVRFFTLLTTNVYMRIEPKRIEIHFPSIPAANGSVNVAVQRVTVRQRNLIKRQDVPLPDAQLPPAKSLSLHRGIPQSALHD